MPRILELHIPIGCCHKKNCKEELTRTRVQEEIFPPELYTPEMRKSVDAIGSVDNKQEKSVEKNSSRIRDRGNDTHESNTDSSDDSNTMFPESKLLQTETMNDLDSGPPGGKLLNTESIVVPSIKSSGNNCNEIKIEKDPDNSTPDGK
ncbi:hypothetical protein AVEN_178128-1 [Araneus ventricosus]|uniref:Uncharacterized protein n=1 Tax=Araneus ventricosus TaxID=182803 RepID=A0A4Y2M8E9_ARAVE|nr:hypothetical protein AVEN_178128-1 [Araneus ventricosus]